MLDSLTPRRAKTVKARCPSYGKTDIRPGDVVYIGCPYRNVCRFKCKCTVAAAERIDMINRRYGGIKTRRKNDCDE